tara:strand:- start:8637 stop:9239 length:603 start_codon:yes stop_codon:yes gene_type:complete
MPNWCTNTLSVEGPAEDIRRFKVTASGPTQTYNEYSGLNKTNPDKPWPINDDIRLRAIAESLPEPGPVQVFSFHALYPVPDEVRRLPYDNRQAKEVGALIGLTPTYGGHAWENAHWGCKWGASEPELFQEEDSFLQYSFDTPWGPPMEFLEKVSSDWPTLSFSIDYEEAGMGFAGNAEYVAGEVTASEEREIEWEEEDEE